MSARYEDLAGRTVFISGGATGIGADLVAAFHGQGAEVFFVDIDRAAGERLCDALAANGAPPRFTECDVTDEAALKAALEAAEEGGGLDVLINNAANDTRRKLEEVDAETWRRAVDVNLRHQFVAAQTAAPWMKARGRGVIVNFASIAPEAMVPDLAVYNICKAGVRGLTRSLARDLGGFGVRVNSILPGAILTERQRKLWFRDQAAIDAVVARQCLPLELNGGHVAAMALFLASDAAAGCTAQDFIVDAGTI
ncbi:SDR family NAD(P)-dependent oxidoreductase [Pikeienuella piscinae]|uniref:SDR family NAD(P)-dependent oxidoreductase n=1 Tax=Pikeienuella piscinae TaxID=2748098 RepID=UPI0015D13D8A|nr:SDR family oxidoreductase [Pikeienuella piscinae]